MKTNSQSLLSVKTKSRLLLLVILSAVSLTLTACQKEADPIVESVEQTPSVTTDTSAESQQIVVDNNNESNEPTAREIDLAELENNIGAAGVTPNAEATMPSPEQAIAGTQITDVQYRSDAGATMTVVFETSATGVLNAIVTLPNQPKLTLSAPEGQGNNPTYRSSDGNIQLISHGGGGSIDLMRDGQLTSYNAVSVEAEVITQS